MKIGEIGEIVKIGEVYIKINFFKLIFLLSSWCLWISTKYQISTKYTVGKNIFLVSSDRI